VQWGELLALHGHSQRVQIYLMEVYE
jgi:hypothetical protein